MVHTPSTVLMIVTGCRMKTRLTLRLAARPVARSLEQLRRWVADHLIQNVPEEMSICEYECQEPDCHIAKWALCEKRTVRAEEILVRID